jgi:hypothetical protein
MIRTRTLVGLAVLCALCMSAFAASSASAKGTTAGECSSTATIREFSDAHCDTASTSAKNFGHILFPAGTATNITAVNDLTGTTSPFALAGKIAGIVIHIECTTVSGTGSVTNKEEGGAMRLVFGASTTSLRRCSVLDPVEANKCLVEVESVMANEADPMTLRKTVPSVKTVTESEEVDPVEEGGTEMGLKLTASGAQLTKIRFSGSECKPAAFKNTFPVTGSAIATSGRGSTEATTSTGATGIFTKASTIKTLKFAGSAATLEGTLTFRKEGGNPLIITTTAI